MKRFGSASCLDSPQLKAAGRTGSSKRDRQRKKSAAAAAASKKQLAVPVGGDANAAADDDELVQLARKRRPSVSNQASLNVDQQGERHFRCAALIDSL